ncbi:B12-binding domain-containing radical SAM protein [Iamia majanohamensis]|uniref:B12-binding domain-containing radical SAM protein n=1 Tax=Iamia majanohamensis TaxID=467976 RepID=UPI00300EDF8F
MSPPLGVAYLAAAVRAEGHDVQVVDAVGEALDAQHATGDPRFVGVGLSPEQVVERVPADADVVGVSCSFSHDWPHDRTTIEALRRRCPTALVVVGGEHVTAVPEEVLGDCAAVDVAVLGEGEETLAEVVALHDRREDLRQVPGTVHRDPHRPGRFVHAPPRQRIRAVDELPRPAWDLVPLGAYLDRGFGIGIDRRRSLPVMATRGCPYRCTFCSSPSMWTTRYAARTPGSVLDEVRDAIVEHDVENVDFYDLTMIIRRSWIVEFCQLVLDSGLDFTWQLPSGTRSEAIDGEVCRLLHAAGCRNLTYAPESGSPRVLDRIQKRVDLDHLTHAVRTASSEGIACTANIIVGFPGETRRDMARTLRFVASLARTGLETCTVAPFSPYPGSQLFAELRAEGRIGALDDQYYLGLSYSDVSRAASWTDHAGPRELQAWRLATLLAFYGLAYATHPRRIVRTWRAVVRGGPQRSRLEQALHDFWRRRPGTRQPTMPDDRVAPTAPG